VLARLTTYIPTAILAALIFYFGFNAMTGDRGILTTRERQATLAEDEAELKTLQAQHADLALRVQLQGSGIDATALLFEFRVVRMPDLAWLSWSVVVLGAIVAIPIGTVAPWLAVVVALAFTLVVSSLFTAARFLVRPRFGRFLAALVLSPPLILTYLVGRCAGLVRLLGVRRSTPTLA